MLVFKISFICFFYLGEFLFGFLELQLYIYDDLRFLFMHICIHMLYIPYPIFFKASHIDVRYVSYLCIIGSLHHSFQWT